MPADAVRIGAGVHRGTKRVVFYLRDWVYKQVDATHTPHRESPTPSMPVQALTRKEKQEIKELIEQFVFSSTGAQCPEQKDCRGIAKKYLSDDKTRYEHCRPDIKAIVKEVRRLYKRQIMQGAACDPSAARSGALHASDTARGASAENMTQGNTRKPNAKTDRGAPRKKTGKAKAEKKPRMTWEDIFPEKFRADDLRPEHLAKMVEFYVKNGYLVLSEAASPEQCERFVREVMLLLDNQGHKPEYKLRFESESGRALDIANDDDWSQIFKILQGPLDVKTRKMVEQGFPTLHMSFGATCAPELCHTIEAIKIRTLRNLYEIASALVGTRTLWCTLDRQIQKLPGKGDDEFLHYDMNPFAEQQEADGMTGIAGKLHMSGGSSFILVPGTHTTEFKTNFVKDYQPLYTIKKNAHKLTLDPTKDPQGLFKQIKRVTLRRGDFIIWHKDLLHGVVERPLNMPIDFGMYLGYMPAVDRPEYKTICGISETDDRRQSFEKGVFPKLYSSLDLCRYAPAKYENFPHLMASYLQKVRDDHPGRCTHLIKSTGKEVPWLQPVRLTPWVPPELTDIQSKVYGLTPW